MISRYFMGLVVFLINCALYANPTCVDVFSGRAHLLKVFDLEGVNHRQTSPSGRLSVHIFNTHLQVRDRENNIVINTNLARHLPNPDHLNLSATEISFSPYERQILVLPKQFKGQKSVNYFVINTENRRAEFKVVPLPEKTIMDHISEGIYAKPGKMIWLQQGDFYGLKVNIRTQKPKPFRGEAKQILLMFTKDHEPRASLGLDLDAGYSLSSVHQNSSAPHIIDVNYHHHQYMNGMLETWDLSTGLRTHMQYLYQAYKPESQDYQLKEFTTPATKILADREQYNAPHRVRSPNGKFWLYFTLTGQSPGDKPAWAIDIIKVTKSSKDDEPFRYALQESIPVEVAFHHLEFVWYQGGEGVILRSDESKIYLWHGEKKIFEVFVADHFELRGDLLYLYYLRDDGTGSVKAYNLISHSFLESKGT